MPNNSALSKHLTKQYENEIRVIRKAAKDDLLAYKPHFLKQISERKIRLIDVKDAIVNGKLIETQDKGPSVRLLFQENSAIPNFLAVVEFNVNRSLCVTAYRPYPDRFILIGDTLRRI
jgi:hypothetical protein